MLSHFDAYNLRARIAPIFLAIMPLVISINLWIPSPFTFQVGVSSFIFTFAISLFSAQFSRQAGKSKEMRLWQSWDGPSTTRFLRCMNTEFNPIRREKCRKNLERMLPDIKLPSLELEQKDPFYSDAIYEACIKFLIGKTRDHKTHPLIYMENINYGFLRNLWGLKPFGIIISLISMLISLLYCWLEWYNNKISIPSILIISFILIMLSLWIFWVKPKAVKLAFDAYAERLLEFCEQMDN